MHGKPIIEKRSGAEGWYFIGTLVLLCLYLGLAHGKASVSQAPAGNGIARRTWATPVEPSFNLFAMSPTLYRSALPAREHLALLQQLKIRTVISFIQDDDRQWLGDAPIRTVSLPLHADRVGDDDVLHALRSIREAEALGAVLIHCKHGSNRTGLVAAMYRIVIQGWSREKALDELYNGGFGAAQDLQEAADYVRHADSGAIRAALAQGEACTTALSSCQVGNWLRQLLDGPAQAGGTPGR